MWRGERKRDGGGKRRGGPRGGGLPTESGFQPLRDGFLLLGLSGSRSAYVFGPKTDGALLDVGVDRPRDDSSFPCLVQLVFTSSLASLLLIDGFAQLWAKAAVGASGGRFMRRSNS